MLHKSSSSKQGLIKQTKIKENSTECDVCLKVFCNKRSLKLHYRTHTGEKPFACRICNKTFPRKDSLVRHQATHTNNRPFKCSICPEARYFKTKNSLTIHMVYHYEPKYSCNYCDHKSYTKCNLNTHEKTHIKHMNLICK